MKQKNQFMAELYNFDHLPDQAYVRMPTVQALHGDMSAASVWRNSGKTIPSPYKLTAGVTAWNVGELRRSFALKPHAQLPGNIVLRSDVERVERTQLNSSSLAPSLTTEERCDERVEAVSLNLFFKDKLVKD